MHQQYRDSDENRLIVCVGSVNPVKTRATEHAFTRCFPEQKIIVQSCKAPSGVSDQPMDENETRQGAINRVAYCQQHQTADFYLAIEGGYHKFEFGPATFAYIHIANSLTSSMGRSALLPLPQQVAIQLEQGDELGDVMDRLFNLHNIKQAGGAIGVLTDNLETRCSVYTQAIILAMVPFLNKGLFNVGKWS
jgi:inosine/xanthosine triphosphatase